LVLASISPAELERTALPGMPAPRTRAPVRGRLVIAPGGEPLDEVLKLRLRTGNARMEELVSAPDGSFVSTLEFSGGLLLLRVFRPDGETAVDLEGPFDPASGEEWIARVPWPTFVHGFVLDAAGLPLSDVYLELVSVGRGEARLRGRSRAGGEFRIEKLLPGHQTLYLQRGFEAWEVELDVARGPNELGELRSPFTTAAGSVSGRLLRRDGQPAALVMLVNVSNGVVATCDAEPERDDEGASGFRFEDVPFGRYRLETASYDGWSYEPSPVELSPPATDLVLRATTPHEVLALEAVDEAGRELDSITLVRLRGNWVLQNDPVSIADVERWVLVSNGGRPASGERPETGARRVTVAPGYGWACLLMEAGRDTTWANGGGVRGRMLAGVQVVADGRVVAESDAAGLALVDLECAPDELAFRLPGWHVMERITTSRLTSVSMARD
jgi:hypothetical protein